MSTKEQAKPIASLNLSGDTDRMEAFGTFLVLASGVLAHIENYHAENGDNEFVVNAANYLIACLEQLRDEKGRWEAE